jgi:hypothetical protein
MFRFHWLAIEAVFDPFGCVGEPVGPETEIERKGLELSAYH